MLPWQLKAALGAMSEHTHTESGRAMSPTSTRYLLQRHILLAWRFDDHLLHLRWLLLRLLPCFEPAGTCPCAIAGAWKQCRCEPAAHEQLVPCPYPLPLLQEMGAGHSSWRTGQLP